MGDRRQIKETFGMLDPTVRCGGDGVEEIGEGHSVSEARAHTQTGANYKEILHF